jgi:histidinol-phosphate aminotransferase
MNKDVLLIHHGDQDVEPGLVDLAVNVRTGTPPEWLRKLLADVDPAHYPDPSEAVIAVARRHGRGPDEVLMTAGAAEAFVLIARALAPRHAVVVHPQFTEPEVALRSAGHPVERVVLREPFTLRAEDVPERADLVVVGNPTNPTSVLHPADLLRALVRPGRVLVVDEAFADTSSAPGSAPSAGSAQPPGEPESLADRRDVPGLVVVRSLTKTWGLAGLRVGYLLGPAELLDRLAAGQPLWAVSTPALAAATACATPTAVAAEREIAVRLAADLDHLVARLAELPGVRVVGEPASAFVLVRLAGAAAVRLALRERGYAVRRGDTFPGLGADWFRVAVRDTATTDAFVAVLAQVLEG